MCMGSASRNLGKRARGVPGWVLAERCRNAAKIGVAYDYNASAAQRKAGIRAPRFARNGVRHHYWPTPCLPRASCFETLGDLVSDSIACRYYRSYGLYSLV